MQESFLELKITNTVELQTMQEKKVCQIENYPLKYI